MVGKQEILSAPEYQLQKVFFEGKRASARWPLLFFPTLEHFIAPSISDRLDELCFATYTIARFASRSSRSPSSSAILRRFPLLCQPSSTQSSHCRRCKNLPDRAKTRCEAL